MRRDKSKPYVVWSCQIEATTLKRFAELLPMQGARAWALVSAIEKYVALTEYSPRLQKLAHEDVQRVTHQEETPTGLSVINLRVPTELYNRWENIMPEWGAITWFTRRIMTELVQRLEANALIPEQLIEASVNELVKERPRDLPL